MSAHKSGATEELNDTLFDCENVFSRQVIYSTPLSLSVKVAFV